MLMQLGVGRRKKHDYCYYKPSHCGHSNLFSALGGLRLTRWEQRWKSWGQQDPNESLLALRKNFKGKHVKAPWKTSCQNDFANVCTEIDRYGFFRRNFQRLCLQQSGIVYATRQTFLAKEGQPWQWIDWFGCWLSCIRRRSEVGKIPLWLSQFRPERVRFRGECKQQRWFLFWFITTQFGPQQIMLTIYLIYINKEISSKNLIHFTK